MAIISFTNYKRGQTTGCMGAVMRYTMQDKKTECDGQQLVTGINCQPESVYADFMTTKRLHHKTGGVLFYHMVQSFPKGEAVDPVAAHAAALKLAEYYEGYEVLVCTHTDREHIHSHFLINSVNFDTGKKLHIAKEQLQELRQRNDQVCVEFSLPVFKQTDRKEKTKTMSVGEYHTAARGQSKKLQLMNIINDCMRHASSREEFIALMESEGYKVRWENSRRNITYTTPSGWQCRDRLLFGDKYLKETMEYEFRIREEVIYGRAVGEEPTCADGTGHTAASGAGADTASRRPSYESGVGGSAERPLHTGVPHRETDWLGLSLLAFQERMVSVQPISNERDIYDLSVQDIFEFPIHIEFIKAQDIVVLTLMPGNFSKGKELVPRHQLRALRGDDLVCLPKGNDPIEVSHRIEVLPQLS